MKLKKVLLIICALSTLISYSANAWWPSGHCLAATIASGNLTQQTREAVDRLLNITIECPGPIYCVDHYPGGNRLVAVATWADNVKAKNVNWGTTKDAQSFYSSTHFIDSILYCNKNNKKAPFRRVREAINASRKLTKFGTPDNAVSALRAAIVTLKSNTASKGEKDFALRYLIHLSGDITQPLHATDPEYYPNPASRPGAYIDTKGGSNILFGRPSSIKVLFDEPEPPFCYYDLHSFWNDIGDSYKFPQIPYVSGNISISMTQQMSLDAEAEILKMDVFNSKNIENSNGQLISFTQLNRNLSNNPDPMEWAADTYVQARDFAIRRGRGFLDLNPGKDRIFTFLEGHQSIIIPRLPHKYRELTKNIAEIQIYKAGIRLANMLNAIFDTKHAPTAYVNFANSLRGKTLDQLCYVNIVTNVQSHEFVY